MLGKEKEMGNEVECYQEDGESYRKPGRKGKDVQFDGRESEHSRQLSPTTEEYYYEDCGEPESKRIRRELVTQKGKDGGEPEHSRQGEEEYYYEDGVGYYVVAGLHDMTPKESDAYCKKVAESEGYDVEIKYTNWFVAGGITKLVINDSYREMLDETATSALEQYNKEEGTRLVLKEVQKANLEVCDGFKYCITLEVKDLDDQHADPVKVFQAQVVSFFGEEGHRVEQIRPKPTTT